MNPEFKVHILNELGIELAKEIADRFDDLLQSLADICPDSREFSICKTKLEEASFYAKKAMTTDPKHQK